MSETKTITPEELQTIHTLQQRQSELIQRAGECVYRQFLLQKESETIQDELAHFDKMREEFIRELDQKYPNAQIDLVSGQIIE